MVRTFARDVDDIRLTLHQNTELARVRGVEDFRVDWQWIPAWRPADITDGGREQLRAIGFTF